MATTNWVVGSINADWIAGTTEETNVKAVYINTAPENAGRIEHNYITWSDTEIVLGPLDKEGFVNNTFYFQVVNVFDQESLWFGPVTILDDLRAVYLNTSATDVGKQLHPYATWSNTSIELEALDKLGLIGSEFYVQVSNRYGSLSDWFGPFTIGAGIFASLNLDASYNIANATEISGTTIHQVSMVLNTANEVISNAEREGEIFVSLDMNLITTLENTSILVPSTVKYITLTLLYGE